MSIRLVDAPPNRKLIIGDGMGEVRVKVKLTNSADDELAATGAIPPSRVRTLNAEAIVDTGAIRCVIPQSLLEQLGVRIRGKEVAHLADGRAETVPRTASIVFDIMGRETSDEALVLGDEVLIGQTVLEKLDLLVDCKNGRLVPNPDHPDYAVTRV
ncbi:MAG: clan AA aspartic protease [Planctomycetota bacterium]|nr:MAG: clan AA aspartic protease [Planctomycetota bacterium]